MTVTNEELLADWQIGVGVGDGVRSLLAFYSLEASNSMELFGHCDGSVHLRFVTLLCI